MKARGAGALRHNARAFSWKLAEYSGPERLCVRAQDTDLEYVHVRKRFGTLYMPEKRLHCRSLR